MATSLARQLEKLKTPQAALLEQSTKRASLIFDPKEAATLDRLAIFEIGGNGFEELKKLNPKFNFFSDSLFSITSIQIERAVQSKELNQQLDANIKTFLQLLSPHFLLTAAHEALEWLIHRFHIHEFNKDDLFALILPYHETGIFVRCLQLINIKSEHDKWNWLYPIQKNSVILPKSALINHCASTPAFMRFICTNIVEKTQLFEEDSKHLTVDYSFYCTTVIGALELTISEAHISQLLPSVVEGISSDCIDFQSSAYTITAELLSRTKLKERLLIALMKKICAVQSKQMEIKAMYLLVLMYQTQNTILKSIPLEVVDMIFEENESLKIHLQEIARSRVYVSPLVLSMFAKFFEMIQVESTIRKYRIFADELLALIRLDDRSARVLIRLAIESYTLKPGKKPNEISLWYCSFIKKIQNEYSSAYERLTVDQVGQGLSIEQKCNLKRILATMPGVLQEGGIYTIFDNLCHHDSNSRALAIKKLAANYSRFSESDRNFIVEPLKDRINDESMEVIEAFFAFDSKTLLAIFGRDELRRNLKAIYFKCENKPTWSAILLKTIQVLCSKDVARDIDHELYFILLPLLFPTNKKQAGFVQEILNSHFGKSYFDLVSINRAIQQANVKSFGDVCQIVIGSLVRGNQGSGERLSVFLDAAEMIERKNPLQIYLILMSLAYAIETNLSAELALRAFNTAMQLVSFETIYVAGDDLKSNVLNCINVAKTKDRIPVQSLIVFLSKLIENLHFPKSKFDLTDMSVMDLLLVRMFENLLVGSCSAQLEISRLYAKTLKQLLKKIGQDLRDLAGFFCMIFLSHEVESEVVSSELQLRTMGMFNALVDKSDEDKSWLGEFDDNYIIPSLIIALSSDLMPIRKSAIDILQNISQMSEKTGYKFLLEEILERSDEIVMDSEQVPLIFYNILTPDLAKSSRKSKMKKEISGQVLRAIGALVRNESSPIYFISGLSKILSVISTREVFEMNIPLVETYIRAALQENRVFNVYESKIFNYTISKMDANALKKITENSDGWKLISLICTNFKIGLIESGKVSYISVKLFDNFTKNLFDILEDDLQVELLQKVVAILTDIDSVDISSSISSFVKRIELNAEHVKDILVRMNEAKSQTSVPNKSKRQRRSLIPRLDIIETADWKCGMTVLEILQNKKKLSNVATILPILFEILKRCLEFEEQGSLEYAKQIILSCILNCSKKLTQRAKYDSLFNIELVVQCIRVTQNPQTHHHALLLLSHTAGMVPEQVLHHMMAIFTFMGSSVLRYDDAYSFQIITKVIDSVIPILIGSDPGEDLEVSEVPDDSLTLKLIPILRVFVDIILDVPIHRRMPLYEKLLNKIGVKHFLWIFLVLLFESHVIHGDEKLDNPQIRQYEKEKETTPKRIGIAINLSCLFPPGIIICNCIDLIQYLKYLPNEINGNVVQNDIYKLLFDFKHRTPKEFRHFKYVIVTFLSNLLALPQFVQSVALLNEDDSQTLEPYYKTVIINILAFIQSLLKYSERNSGKPQERYWKVMLFYSFDILNHINSLLTSDMFILVIKGLMAHNVPTIRRKAMELFNSRLTHQTDFCRKTDVSILIDPLMQVVNSISETDEEMEEELNQQTALLSLKLIARNLAVNNPEKFRPILENIIQLLHCKKVNTNVSASLVLCLAELVSNLKAHALYSLSKFMPLLLKIFKDQRNKNAPDMMVLSIVTATFKVVDTLPLFLNPYLEKMLFEISVLDVKWKDDEKNSKISPILLKLKSIKNKLASSIPHRVLIPSIGQTYANLLSHGYFDAVGVVMDILSNSLTNINRSNLQAILPDLTDLFLSALQFRADNSNQDNITFDDISTVEGHILKGLMAIVLKLSESSFRPLYYKLFDWATRNTEQKDRTLTFYRLSCEMADCLKGLFVLFAGHFLTHAAKLLDRCNKIKHENLFFDDENKCVLLVEYIIKTLYLVFLNDNQNFITKDRFDTLMQPIVDQLENTIGGRFSARVDNLLKPCISQFAVAVADDSLWKQLNYQILLKTRHNLPEVRLAGLQCLCETAKKLGDEYLPLLPETIPFLAELLEDEDENVEQACQKAVQELEKVLGEPLQKYF